MLKFIRNHAPVEQDELKGFARTIAEIDWLLLILVLAYLVAVGHDSDDTGAIVAAALVLGGFILVFRYINFYEKETLEKIALETVVMITFITWVTWHSGMIESPLLNLYLLPIIASALILGKLVTIAEAAVIAVCLTVMALESSSRDVSSIAYWSTIFTRFAPIVLVAYFTTMLSADIRYAVAKIKLISDMDELTGIYNLRAFTAILRRVFQQTVRHDRQLSIIMIDSDNLKTTNDTYGHEAGNRLLQHLVRKFSDSVRRSDFVGRYGGDEFIILLPETARDGAIETAERIRKSIASSRFDIRNGELRTTVSLGVASYPDDGGDLEVILEKADRALYRAKKNGRNQTAVYEFDEEPEPDKAYSERDLK